MKRTKISKLTRTSERSVFKHFVTCCSINANMPLDLVSSIRQSHCFSSSITFVAVRIITFWHLICKKQSLHFWPCIFSSYINIYKCMDRPREWLQNLDSLICQLDLLSCSWPFRYQETKLSYVSFQAHTKGTFSFSWCNNSVIPSGNWAIWKGKPSWHQIHTAKIITPQHKQIKS